MTILLNNNDINLLLNMPDCINVLESAYRELGNNHAAYRNRTDLVSPGIKPDTMYILKSMDGLIPDSGVSCVRITSDMHHFYKTKGQLRRSKLPAAPKNRYTGLGVLLSTETTEPLMIFTDGAINPSRVAATTALGIKYLAKKDSKIVALLGCGKQADKQISGVINVRNIEKIKCYSPTKKNRKDFANKTTKKYGVQVVDTDTPEEAVENADIILCATNARSHVFKPEWAKPGMHIGCITQFEIPPETVMNADIAYVHTNVVEPKFTTTHGLSHPEKSDKNDTFVEISSSVDRPNLGELVTGRGRQRAHDQEITIYLNTVGIGLQFTAVAALLYRKAKEKGIGNHIPTDWLTQSDMS